MSGEAWLYLLAVIINAVNLFLQVFFTIMSVHITPARAPSDIILLAPCETEQKNIVC
jgi:hypothetical protein